jgi:Periplasmic copper-binding protein (NosD)
VGVRVGWKTIVARPVLVWLTVALLGLAAVAVGLAIKLRSPAAALTAGSAAGAEHAGAEPAPAGPGAKPAGPGSAGGRSTGGRSAGSTRSVGPGSAGAKHAVASAGPTRIPVCGQPVLHSPYHYRGAPGPYRSGKSGLPTFGAPGTDFPSAAAGVVLRPETADYQNWQLKPNTVYYLAPGMHYGSFSANTGDVFVGGYANGVGSTLDGQYSRRTAIDSNITVGEQKNVTIEYLTIQRFTPLVDQTAINQTGAGGWKLVRSTVSDNVPGGGMFAASDSVLKGNCLTRNGQYGFQSAETIRGDSLTHGPYNVWIENNEISYNDVCDLSGLLNNAALGWKNYNPVPLSYRNAHCGTVQGDGNQGGFKLWATNGVMIKANWIHHNWGVGGWADTDNANTTWTGNTITDNENGAIWEEISYNFSITNNYIARNNLTDGPRNPGFPMPAIYISESGSDSKNGGVSRCTMASCIRSGMPGYPAKSLIQKNTLVDNGGGIFLWQSSNRHCNDGFDHVCTLAKGAAKGPFSVNGCAKNLASATIDRTTYRANVTGSPSGNYWDGCMWQTQNVDISANTINFNPANIPGCTAAAWPACGANGVFSQYGGPNGNAIGPDVPTQITFFQNNRWHNNVYRGPSRFFAWNQGNLANPVRWADWTGPVSKGDKCTSPGERQSGTCTGPFGQDSGSRFTPAPSSSRSRPSPRVGTMTNG